MNRKSQKCLSLKQKRAGNHFVLIYHNTLYFPPVLVTVALCSDSARVVRKSSETDSIKFKISSKTSRGKKDSTKDTIIDITSDSQVNSNFPNRWSQASLTFNNYFYLFLYLYITWITINNNAPHLKSPKNQNRRAALGRPAIKITGGLQLVCGRPTLALSSALVPQTHSCLVCVEDF